MITQRAGSSLSSLSSGSSGSSFASETPSTLGTPIKPEEPLTPDESYMSKESLTSLAFFVPLDKKETPPDMIEFIL